MLDSGSCSPAEKQCGKTMWNQHLSTQRRSYQTSPTLFSEGGFQCLILVIPCRWVTIPFDYVDGLEMGSSTTKQCWFDPRFRAFQHQERASMTAQVTLSEGAKKW